jgi:carboxypeptidase C (cathepsin A)
MFYAAYFKKDTVATSRPLIFLYNGGPGSSTMWLHMGAFGPRHVVTEGVQHPAGAPYTYGENKSSL